ncbi:MAG TPA: hypothetical protein PK441_01240 [Burkholderiaceae bacterium]|nr:hypothetical protein [Burkholderiaceae bacterium]
MTLAAAQVIDALAARLTPVVLSGGRVFTSRSWPITVDELPAWRVVAEGETAERQYVGQTINEHALSVSAVGYVRAVANLDDAMHALAAAGMTALFAVPAPYDLQLDSISRSMSTEGDAAVGVITVNLTARFAADQATPETIF